MRLSKANRDALAYTLMSYMQTINFYGSDVSSISTHLRLSGAKEVLEALGVGVEMVANEDDGKYQCLVIDGWKYVL